MILVIDLGTQSFRATVLDRFGSRVYRYSRPIETHSNGLISEQDPAEWRQALQEALSGVDRPSIRAVAAAATLSGLVCLGDDDVPLRPAILYSDRRPGAQLAEIQATREYRACPYRAYSGDFLPQLHYLRDAEPENFRRAKYLLDATGYLNYLLTGQATLDRYTTFTCYGDPTGRVPKLGRIVEPGETIGHASGFENARVISVSYDSAAAYLGANLARPGDALDISGTVTSFGVRCARQITDPERRIFSVPYGDAWLVRGSTALAGGVLDWARTTLFDWTLDEFNRAVMQSPPGANGVTFLPFLAGARTPLWDPAASGVFHGLSAQTSKADMARAVCEGLCYALQHIVQTIEECGAPVRCIQLSGGLSRNALLSQMKADITGRRVQPLADTEVTTLGAASIAARAIGWLGAEESWCRLSDPMSPDAARHNQYELGFDRYERLATHVFAPGVAPPVTA